MMMVACEPLRCSREEGRPQASGREKGGALYSGLSGGVERRDMVWTVYVVNDWGG